MKRNVIGQLIQGCLLVSSLTVAGCSGHTVIGADGSGGQSGSADSPSGPGGDGGFGGQAFPFGGSNSGGAPQGGGSNSPACAVPAGTLATLNTTKEFYDAIVGRWLICAGGLDAFGGEPSDVIGVEYATPTMDGEILRGNMYYLVDSPDGVVRGAGFDYQLTYDVSPQDPAQGPPVQLNMHPAPNSGFGGSFKYSPSPRQWQLSGGSANPEGSAVLVPAD